MNVKDIIRKSLKFKILKVISLKWGVFDMYCKLKKRLNVWRLM